MGNGKEKNKQMHDGLWKTVKRIVSEFKIKSIMMG